MLCNVVFQKLPEGSHLKKKVNFFQTTFDGGGSEGAGDLNFFHFV